MLHKSFLFDYNRYINKVTKLVPNIDKGDFYHLFVEARNVFDNTPGKKWILHDLGTTLECLNIEEVKYPYDVGYLLLVILSKFLRIVPSLNSDWRILMRALKVSGWNDDDLQLLLHGTSTAYLLKPDVTPAPENKLVINSPYFLWVKPTQAYHSGWLNSEQIIHLESRLLSTKSKILSFDESNLNMIVNDEPFSSTNTTLRLNNSYDIAVSMISLAKREKQGLYMILS